MNHGRSTPDPSVLETWGRWSRERAASFFQTSSWASLLVRHFPQYSLAPICSDRYFIPLIRRRRYGGITDSLYGMPMMTTGGIFFADEPGEEDWASALSALSRLQVGTLVISLPLGAELKSVTDSFFLEKQSTHILSLVSGWDSILKGYDRHCRKSIRKAIKESVEVVRDESEEGIREHWNLVEAQFARWKPNPPLSFEFLRDAIGSEQGRLYLARQGERTVVSLLAFAYGREVFMWQAARVEKDFPLGADNLLRSEIIRESCEQGFERINLGGSLGHSGIERFKETFGAQKVESLVLKYIHPLVRIAKRFA